MARVAQNIGFLIKLGDKANFGIGKALGIGAGIVAAGGIALGSLHIFASAAWQTGVISGQTAAAFIAGWKGVVAGSGLLSGLAALGSGLTGALGGVGLGAMAIAPIVLLGIAAVITAGYFIGKAVDKGMFNAQNSRVDLDEFEQSHRLNRSQNIDSEQGKGQSQEILGHNHLKSNPYQFQSEQSERRDFRENLAMQRQIALQNLGGHGY